MAWRRAAFASLTVLRSSASRRRLVSGVDASAVLHEGQRLAKPGLSGFSSNSSEQTAQILIGKTITTLQLYDSACIRCGLAGQQVSPLRVACAPTLVEMTVWSWSAPSFYTAFFSQLSCPSSLWLPAGFGGCRRC